MSLANLCNRLDCQRAPLKPTNSRTRGSHLPDPLFRFRPSPNTLVLSSDAVSSEVAPNSPRASPIPSDATIWRRCTSGDTSSLSPPWRPPLFFLGGVSVRAWILSRHARRAMWSPTLPVALRRPVTAFAMTPDAEPRTLSLDTRQGIHLPDPKCLPPIGPFRSAPAGAEDETWGPPLIPWLSRRGSASDTRSPTSLWARPAG